MKRKFFVVVLFLAAMSVFGQSRQTVTDSNELDRAIKEATSYLNGRIAHRTVLAVINIQSDYTTFSEYIISELNANIINDDFFSLVERQQLNAILKEQDVQLSGAVDDKSAVSIGKVLGAQTIIIGSVSPMGSQWRIQIRALDVQTAQVHAQVNKNLPHSEIIEALTGITFTQPTKTVVEKIGTGALNILFGLGSYLEGDISGGITLTAGYLVAAGLFVVEATALDWDNPAVGIPAVIGVSVAGLTLVYGFARPFIYNCSPQVAAVMDNTQFNVVQTADTCTGKKDVGIQMIYTMKF